MRVSKLMIVIAVVGGLCGCTKTSETSSATTSPTSSEMTSGALHSSSSPTSAAATSTTVKTIPRTTSGIEIEYTLAPIGEHSSPPRLMVADTEPSLNDGSAVPSRPTEPCGFVSGVVEPDVYSNVMGCEFASEADAEDYLSAWKAAIDDPSPVYQGGVATTVAITELADWWGRTLTVPKRSDEIRAVTRSDLVRRFGTRVYVATASVEGTAQADVVAQAINLATAQQAFILAKQITASTVGAGRENESSRISVRYLTPSWQEMATLGRQRGPVGTDVYAASSSASATRSEWYQRAIITSQPLESGGSASITATIELLGTVGDAQREALLADDGFCEALPKAVPDSITAWTCSTYDGGLNAGAQHGQLRLSLQIPAEVGADPAVVQQIMRDWEDRLAALGYPMGHGAIESVTSPARTSAPLPTDRFDAALADGQINLVDAFDVVDDGEYYTVTAQYDVGDITPANVTIFRALNDVTDLYGDPIPADQIASVSADYWTTYRQFLFQNTDPGAGKVSRSYLCYMVRVLPSGNVITVRADEYQVGGEPLHSSTPCFEPDGPFLTGLWGQLQSFSLATFPADEQESSVRHLAVWFTSVFYFSGYRISRPVNAKVAPDSPPGSVAEWRTVWSPGQDAPAGDPTITQQVINFATPDDAAAFVQRVADNKVLTPLEAGEGLEGGWHDDSGMIVVRRGKWVAFFSSPGRKNWADLPFEEVPIAAFANEVARYLRATGLE